VDPAEELISKTSAIAESPPLLDMMELAFTVHGEVFEIPSKARGLRVRRLDAKGALHKVRGSDGKSLILPVDTNLDDLRRLVNAPGLFQLEPVYRSHSALADAEPGYVFVHGATLSKDQLVIEAMRMNAQMTREIMERCSRILESAALLRAEWQPIPARLLAHFISIQSILDPHEAALARDIAAGLTPAELFAWLDELGQLPTADAAKRLRGLFATKDAA
jgi:hypothetical protein